MKLLYCGLYYDYGHSDRGPSFEEINIGDALRHMDGVDLTCFHFDLVRQQGHNVDAEFVSLVRREQPDLTLIVLFEDDFSTEALEEARRHTTLVSWGCDDHWRFQTGYMQRYAPHFDCCITTYRHSVPDYSACGQTNVVVGQWGCNQHFFRPRDGTYLYDVSCVGQNYGPRKTIMDHLWREGISVTLFGRNWPRTRRGWKRGLRFTLFGRGWTDARYAEFEELPTIYSRSKINLCLSNNMTGVDNIKGRNFEAPACRGFLISGPARDLDEYFEIDKEVVIYRDLDDLVYKIQYYLEHEKERENIAKAAYERCMKEHTYDKRFRSIFDQVAPGWDSRR